MSTSAAAVFSQAKELSEADCEELYLRLGDHLYGPQGGCQEISEEMKATLDRRWQEITSGQVQGVNPLVALQEARAKHHV